MGKKENRNNKHDTFNRNKKIGTMPPPTVEKRPDVKKPTKDKNSK